MTVEHLIGRSQGGYLTQIRELVDIRFPHYSNSEKRSLAEKIDALNTVTACQFCNSTTSRDVSDVSMYQLFENSAACEVTLIKEISTACDRILDKKRQSVRWKLESVRAAFNEHVLTRIENGSRA